MFWFLYLVIAVIWIQNCNCMLPDIHHVCRGPNKPTSETCWQRNLVGMRVCESYRKKSNKIFMCMCVRACVPTSKGSQQDLLVKRHGALVRAAHHVPHCFIDGKSGEGIWHLTRERKDKKRKNSLFNYWKFCILVVFPAFSFLFSFVNRLVRTDGRTYLPKAKQF